MVHRFATVIAVIGSLAAWAGKAYDRRSGFFFGFTPTYYRWPYYPPPMYYQQPQVYYQRGW